MTAAGWQKHVWRYADTYEWMDRLRGGFAPLVITCAVSGGVQGKESNPNIPETPAEIAQSVSEAYNAGATAVHVHGRDPQKIWDCTLDPDVLRDINRRIREKCSEIIINNTTGGGLYNTMEDRYRTLDARPELASLNMGPDMSRFRLAPRPAPLAHPRDAIEVDETIAFTYGIIEKLARLMKERDIKPEMEIYHPGQYWVTRDLIEKDLLRPPYLHQFVMGYQTSIFPSPANVMQMVSQLPNDSAYFVAGIGPYQLPLTTFSILMGGHIRVGLEDNVYYSRGRKIASNAESVERAVRIARELNREIATPALAREILGVSPTPRTFD